MKTILLVLTLSLDAFIASIAYGTNKIKVPFFSIIIINIICSFFFGFSVFLGYQFKKILPGNIAIILSFSILFLLGIYYLFESIVKSYLGKSLNISKTVKIKLFDMQFMISIYADETLADFDHSKVLEYKEALYLGTALSLDSLAVGFGSSLGEINYLYVIVLSFILGISSMISGLVIGGKLAEKTKINLSWLSGLILIILAILKII